MNPFADPVGAAPYPASDFRRSDLPSPQETAPTLTSMPTAHKQGLAVGIAIFVVLAFVLFHWHYQAD